MLSEYTVKQKLRIIGIMINILQKMRIERKIPINRYKNGLCHVFDSACDKSSNNIWEDIRRFSELNNAITIAMDRNGKIDGYINYPYNRHYQYRIALLKRVEKSIRKKLKGANNETK